MQILGSVSRFNPSVIKIPNFIRTRASSHASMALEAGATKRPICCSCSKPLRTCLCSRFTARNLNNSIAVTILQHTAEQKHPLNSARIAKIGLKNVDVFLVSDVCLRARFFLRFLDEMGHDHKLFDEMLMEEDGDKSIRNVGFESCNFRGFQFSIEKYGSICSINDPIAPSEYHQLTSLEQLLELDHRAAKGFLVKKLQKTRMEDGGGDVEEFEMQISCGSVLLFPSESSVGLEEIDFQVKNLIVLDGTWAKARRMYNENPWLRLLPHVKLDMEKTSLYSEVRHQPRAGYLSTIESIVYALRELDCDIHGGLDGLLDVFESMVSDQRHCKNERLKKTL